MNQYERMNKARKEREARKARSEREKAIKAAEALRSLGPKWADWKKYSSSEKVEQRNTQRDLNRKKQKAAAKRQRKAQAVKAAEQAQNSASARFDAGRAHPMNWQVVPQVLCPHCQEKGKVEKYLAPAAPERSLTKVFFDSMLEDTARLDRLETQGATAEVERKLDELRDEVSAPNMRCKNCTVEWKA